MNAEIHFFDLDGVLWNIHGKVWVIAKDNPNVPLVKLDREEFALIKAGMYKEDEVEIEYNDETYWISQDLMDRVIKKRKIEEDMVGFSFRELFDTNYIDNITIIMKNIIDLNNKQVDIGILSGRHDQVGEKEYINQLRIKLNELKLDINKIYYLGERFQYGTSDSISFSKTRILLEHLVGTKIEKDRFMPLKQDWYKKVYFYDDEIQNIHTASKIQVLFDDIIRNTDDETFKVIMERVAGDELTLFTNLISNNILNKFRVAKIVLREPMKFPIKMEGLDIKKFGEF